MLKSSWLWPLCYLCLYLFWVSRAFPCNFYPNIRVVFVKVELGWRILLNFYSIGCANSLLSRSCEVTSLPLKLSTFAGIPMIFLICRWRHRRRMDQLNSRERFLDYTPSEIHAEHVGDSTLQVTPNTPFNISSLDSSCVQTGWFVVSVVNDFLFDARLSLQIHYAKGPVAKVPKQYYNRIFALWVLLHQALQLGPDCTASRPPPRHVQQLYFMVKIYNDMSC